ncbi:DUF3459 domain-containing protein, partial [Streptomyces sp. NPDC051597]|uniref:DUF3459 domain-containing protein n=1 Tax=Streptomyces sp. NPDC051597 TaxID=3155049 RepID=UPI00342BB4B9
RVPIPWTEDGPSYGFGSGGSWLPQPDSWRGLSVEAQTGDPGSTLELYRAALAARRAHPGLGRGDAVRWLEAPEGVLVFAREGFVCTVNLTGEPVRLPAPESGKVLLSSAGGDVLVEGEEFVLDADTTVWWAV